MRRSAGRINTTHVGSLPRPDSLVAPLYAKDTGAAYDIDRTKRLIAESVSQIAKRQIDLGLDIVNDGEHSKSSFSSYVRGRLGGLEPASNAKRGPDSKDELAFPGAYADLKATFAARKARLGRPASVQRMAVTGPLTYIGLPEVQADIENLRAAIKAAKGEHCEGFMTALSLTSIAQNFENLHYRSASEFLEAIGEVMRVEYKAIVDAGFIVQIDDPRLITQWDRSTADSSLEAQRKFMRIHVEALNHALRGIPSDRVRFHTCYGTNFGPRTSDLELKHYVDEMLSINADGYSIEAANPRHEHEWRVWEDVKLPDGKVLIPGVISHCVYQVEHPELVAERIMRFASVVGRERIVASSDCGFATSVAGDDLHPEVTWAKIAALVEGARVASARLWGRAN